MDPLDTIERLVACSIAVCTVVHIGRQRPTGEHVGHRQSPAPANGFLVCAEGEQSSPIRNHGPHQRALPRRGAAKSGALGHNERGVGV
jgi:hypothetical protein